MNVYLVRQASQPELVKIGYSAFPTNRMDALRHGSPEKLELIATVQCKSVRHAHFVEKRAHDYYADNRTLGEWFRIESTAKAVATISRIAEACADRFLDERGVERVPEKSEVVQLLERSIPLSAREKEVVELYAMGHQCCEVAEMLGKSAKTISTYAKRAATKLGLRNAKRLHHLARLIVEERA